MTLFRRLVSAGAVRVENGAVHHTQVHCSALDCGGDDGAGAGAGAVEWSGIGAVEVPRVTGPAGGPG